MARKLVANQDNTSTSSQTEPLSRAVARPIFGESVLAIDYNFADKGILDDDITFSRASGATQTNSEGKVAFAPNNLLPYSENFGHSDWSKYNVATATSTILDPFAGTGSYVLKEASTATNNKLLIDSHAVVNGGTYIFSVYAKAKELSILQLILGNVNYAGGNNHANFDLTNGAVTATGGGCVAKIEKIGSDGWYRCSLADTTSASGNTEAVLALYNSPTAVRASTYAGNGTDGVYVFGAMSEQTFDKNASPSAYLKSSGGAEQAPRFDWTKDGSSKGLLIEEARTNLQANSNQWVVATHSINNFNAITNNFAISPTGQRDAWRGECYDTGGAARHEFYTRFNQANATQYTQSIYIKPFGLVTHLRGSEAGATSRGAAFDLINCQVITNGGMGNQGATIEDVGNGWRRVSFTYTSTYANTDNFIYWSVADAASDTFGNSIHANFNPGKGSGVYVWGVQQEAGGFPTSLIPTYGATASRSGDSAVVSGLAFSRFHKDAKGGSWIVEAEDIADQGSTSDQAAVIKVYEGGNTFLGFGKGFGGGTLNRPAIWYKDGVSGGDMIYNSNFGNGAQTIDKNASYKLGVALDVNDAAWTMNGHLGVGQSDTSVPSLYSPTEVRLGTSASHEYSGHIRRVRYFNKRISDAKLVKETNTDFLLNKYQHVKAAHSLRQLKEENTNSPVTRIRRDYDSYEADYTANQVTNGELEADFQSEKQTTLPLDVSCEADEMVVNGTFSANSDWNATTAGTWAIANGVASKTGAGSRFTQQVPTVKGKQYKVIAEISSHSNGQASLYFEGSYSSEISSAGVLEYIGVATDNSTQIGIYGNSGSIFSVDSISVKEVNPIATGFSTRKINSSYTGKAMRCRNQGNVEVEVGFDDNNEISLSSPVTNSSQNLIASSENFGNNWTLQTCNIEKYSGLDPFGGTNATKLTATSGASSGPYYIASATSGKSYTLSVYIKAEEATRTRVGWWRDASNWVAVELNWSASGIPTTHSTTNATNVTYEAIGTDGWYRVSLVGVADSLTSVNLDPDSGANNKSAIFYGVQLEETQYSSTGSTVTGFDSTFSGTGPKQWGSSNAGLASVSGGKGVFNTDSTQNLRIFSLLTVGKKYHVQFDVEDYVSGSVRVNTPFSAATYNAFTPASANGTFTFEGIAALDALYISTIGATELKIDNVVVTEFDTELQTYAQTPVISNDGSSTTATDLQSFAGKENLVQYSEDFSNAFWSKQSCTQVPNSGTDPNGGSTATKIVPDSTGTNRGLLYNAGSNLDNIVYNWSVYVKKGLSDYAYFTKGANGSWGSVWFNLATGEVGTVQTGWSNVTMTSVGNDWYRISATVTMAGTSDYLYILQADGNGSATVTKDGDKGLLVWGAQLNTNSLKTYQATTSTALTGDVNVVNWYDQAGGEDFTQSTAGEQPRIVMGGELVTDSGGKASVYFDGGDTLQNSTLAGNNRLDIYTIQDTTDATYIYPADPTSGSKYGLVADNGSAYALHENYGTPSFYVNGALQSFGDRDDVHDALTGSTKLVSQHNASTSSWGNLEVGHYNNTASSSYNYTGKISEMVFFPNLDSSPKRFPIEQNMLNHFDVNLYYEDFNDDTGGWIETESGGSNTTLSHETTNPLSGSGSLKIALSNTGTSGGYPRVRKNTGTAFRTGIKYRLSFKAKALSGTGECDIRFGTSSTNMYWVTNQAFTTTEQTYTYTDTFDTLPTAGTDAIQFIFDGTKGPFELLIDDVKVEELGVEGYVTKLYDQAGNNIHLEQSTAANQPQAISGGETIKLNNRPTMRFDGTNDHLKAGGRFPALTQPNVICCVVRPVHESGLRYICDAGIDGTGTGQRQILGTTSDDKVEMFAGTWANLSTVLSETAANLLWANFDASNSTLDLNGAVDSSGVTPGGGALDSLGIGARMNNSANLEGDISEFLIWDINQESSKLDIKANINTHYNIY